MKMKRILIAVMVLTVMVCCIPVHTYAANDTPIIQPRWTSIHHMEVGMSFSGSDGNASGIASKQSTADLIEGTLYVYQLVDDEWEYMGEWYKSKAVGSLGISGDFVCVSGVTYKAVFTVTAYTDGVPETHTIEYTETCS